MLITQTGICFVCKPTKCCIAYHVEQYQIFSVLPNTLKFFPLAKRNNKKELHSALDIPKTRTDTISVAGIRVLGSVQFLVGSAIFFMVWICWNLQLLGLKPFDPFPCPILELIVSIFAITLSVSVLINQNRQGRADKIRQQVDFEVNVRAEAEITKVLNMLHAIEQKLGIDTRGDTQLEEMKETTNVKQIHKNIDEEGI